MDVRGAAKPTASRPSPTGNYGERSSTTRTVRLKFTSRGCPAVIAIFAHHPPAVAEPLGPIREAHPNHRLWAVFEPRTATSRRNVFQSQYAGAFQAADETIITATLNPTPLEPQQRFSPEKLVEDLVRKGPKARHIPAVEEIVASLAEDARREDLVVIMSNGGFGGMLDQLLEALRNKVPGR